jgi:hypothetical protein
VSGYFFSNLADLAFVVFAPRWFATEFVWLPV